MWIEPLATRGNFSQIRSVGRAVLSPVFVFQAPAAHLVRMTACHLFPAQVTFLDAQWESGLLALVERVAWLLGHEPGAVSATLCRALLSTPGGHFLPHKASWLAADSFRLVRDGSSLR